MWRKIRRIFLKIAGDTGHYACCNGGNAIWPSAVMPFKLGSEKKPATTWAVSLEIPWLLKASVLIFSRATLGNVLLTDKHRDTFFRRHCFNYWQSWVKPPKAFTPKCETGVSTCKIIRYKNDSTLNFGLLPITFLQIVPIQRRVNRGT